MNAEAIACKYLSRVADELDKISCNLYPATCMNAKALRALGHDLRTIRALANAFASASDAVSDVCDTITNIKYDFLDAERKRTRDQ